MREKLAFRFMFATTLVVIFVMTIHFFWEYNQQKQQALLELIEKAQVITKQLVATREFISTNQDRINFDSKGNYEFKHLNPAAVGMGTADAFGRLTDYKIKQTRIHYRDSRNAPDEFEVQILKRFEANPELQEMWSEETIEGESVFRYMIPLKIEKSCLACHGSPAGEVDVAGYPKEGYSEGNLGGAISLIMPMNIISSNLKANATRYGVFFLLLIIVFIFSIYILMKHLVSKPLSELEKALEYSGSGNMNIDLSNLNAKGEIKHLAHHFQKMAGELGELYINLEKKVKLRTTELERANHILKLNEQQLTQTNSKLEEANKFKSDFLAIMSHELRTPLTSIIAFTKILLEELPDNLESERQNLMEIESNSENLLHLINNILDVARIEAGWSEVRFETMDMTDVICSVEGMFAPMIKTKGIVLTTRIDAAVPLIKADPEKIRRIVQNLTGNAIKFTEAGGKVNININYEQDRNEIIITVADTGIGIKQKDLATIFDRFVQADSSTSRKFGGTGLGLSLAKELAEMHGGWITVESVYNQGSIFKVGIPAVKINE